MSKKFWSILVVVGIVLGVSLACNLPFTQIPGLNPPAEDNPSGENPSSEEGGAADEPVLPEPTAKGEDKPNPRPIGFQEGLGSLDSYKLSIKVLTTGTDGSTSNMEEWVETSIIDGNSHTKTTNTSKEADDSESSSNTSETYNLGPVTCDFTDGEWAYSKKSDLDKEMMDVFSQMVDFVPVIKDPEFVGEENINGIQTNHFRFKVPGIGKKSGAVATQNQGEYWLAVDGQYIIKYSLVLQVQTAAEGDSEAKITSLNVSYDMMDINVPVSITQPAECVPPAP